MEENEGNSQWQINLTDEAVHVAESSSDSKQLFLEEEDWRNEKTSINKLNKNYWNKLRQCLRSKISNSFSFTLIERAYFDYGLNCGEQFCKEADVLEALEALTEEDTVATYEAVFETLLDEIKGHIGFDDRFLTMSRWLTKRYEYHQILGQTVDLKMNKKIISKLPEEYKKLLVLRDERIELIATIAKLFEKTPGMTPELNKMICEGHFHDEIDFCILLVPTPREMVMKAKRMNGLWSSICVNIRSIFQNKKVDSYIRHINIKTEEIQKYCKAEKINLEKLNSEANELAVSDDFIYKTMQNELMLVKNNLNVGSMRSKRKQHFPLLKKIVSPCDINVIKNIIEKAELKDSFCPIKCDFVLAPGEFDAFYEVDRESLVLPLYDNDALGQVSNCIVDYRVRMESFREKSEFLDEAKDFFGAKLFKAELKKIYKFWLDPQESQSLDLLNKKQLNFLHHHITPSVDKLFLNNHLYFSDSKAITALRTRIEKKGVYVPVELHTLSAQYFKVKKYEMSLKLIKKAFELDKNPLYVITQAILFEKLGKKEEAEALFTKCSRLPLKYPQKLYMMMRK